MRSALEQRRVRGEPSGTTARPVARGDGWSVADVVCTSGPQDHPFEERHATPTIAIVLAGSFQYRTGSGHALMTPGSLMLGAAGQCFECGHEHASGDRCVSFTYAPEYFERIIADAGHRGSRQFAIPRLPPLRALAPLVASAAAGVTAPDAAAWQQIALKLAARAMILAAGGSDDYRLPRNAAVCVTRAVRLIAAHPEATLTLDRLARHAGLSPYHFLRTFERLTGLTPHRYIMRARLREAAARLSASKVRIVDIALDCGFGDVSNFNRAFRAEFGLRPREVRRSVVNSR